MCAVIIVISGPPCSGKSSFASQLRLDSDSSSFAFFEMDELRLSLSPRSHTARDRARAYARMHELAYEACQGGATGAILVATYQPSEQRNAVRSVANGLGAPLIILECVVDPNEAVKRFTNRDAAHPATDLTAERVWDLAQDFNYADDATQIDTTEDGVVDRVKQIIHDRIATASLDKWVACGNPPYVQRARDQADGASIPLKLTARSRRYARVFLGLRCGVGCISLLCLVSAAIVLMKEVLSLLFVELRTIGFEGDPAEWFQIWAVAAALASGAFVLFEQLFGGERAKAERDIGNAGRIPCMAFRHLAPSNVEVYRRYIRRTDPGCHTGFVIKDFPIWFLVQPSSHGFEVTTKVAPYSPVDTMELQRRAASKGLDWCAFRKWREEDRRAQYYDRFDEDAVRALNISTDSQNDTCVVVEVCKGHFASYLCTELSANLVVEGRYGFELRELFEGDNWIKSTQINRSKYVQLENLAHARTAYEMLIGVQVGITTRDGYLLLQKRSERVQAAAGGVVSSGAGGALWRDLSVGDGLLTASALRETYEEIGWLPHPDDVITAPFLGAAFNLLRGRDLNFYCHFHTRWTLEEISEGPLTHFRRVLSWTNPRKHRRPIGVRNARDAWEVAHIIPVPVGDVLAEGKLSPRFESMLGDSRHVRGLLYCLAQSEKFREIRSQFQVA